VWRLGFFHAHASQELMPPQGGLDQFQHVVEAVRPAVWVRNFADAGLRRELEEEPQPVATLRRCG
jgi:hypothetical protein